MNMKLYAGGHSPPYFPRIVLLLLFLTGCGPDEASKVKSDVNRPSTEAKTVPPVDVRPAEEAASERRQEQEFDQLPAEISFEDTSLQNSRSDLARQREALDETVWRDEVLAQQYERALVRLWDALLAQNRAPNGDAYSVFEQVRFDTLRIGTWTSAETLEHRLQVRRMGPPFTTIHPDDWARFLHELRAANYQLVQSEWHHARFDADVDGAARSTVAMSLYLHHVDSSQRLVVSGNLEIRNTSAI